MIEIGSGDVTEIFSAFGQVGLSAEKIVSIAARDARANKPCLSGSGRRASDRSIAASALFGWNGAVHRLPRIARILTRRRSFAG
jgi:hypothetical protein